MTDRGPVWGVETEDLNATILEWPPGADLAVHVNDECDVLLVVLAGSVGVEIDGEPNDAGAGEVVVIRKGSARRIRVGPEGTRYLTVHRRRRGLAIGGR
jgi:mannose-6-phosphate isomerase-like protein (cupin superfamily)